MDNPTDEMAGDIQQAQSIKSRGPATNREGRGMQRGKRNIHNSRKRQWHTAASSSATVDGPGDPQDRRQATEESRDRKRRKQQASGSEGGQYAASFTKEEISQETRKPKRKVAVMIGYSGTGYKGMQLNQNEKTIEGDLFAAFVAAGAISKANADDPRKSSLVRCARTDKGVHAAGNVISLKLIIEDPDIIAKINSHLPDQIRIWGIERTQSSFSCYLLCDSRMYEYLMPSYCLLPPHPESYLGKKLVEMAGKEGDLEGYHKRQEEVSTWWAEAEAKFIQPLILEFDEDIREEVLRKLHAEERPTPGEPATTDEVDETKIAQPQAPKSPDETESIAPSLAPESTNTMNAESADPLQASSTDTSQSRSDRIATAIRRLRHTYRSKVLPSFRLPPRRLERLQAALSEYNGTHSFHNYATSQYSFRNASSTRHIKSFTPTESSPFLIDSTEWVSLKVHGQSFMTHQIRKMVSLAILLVRCGGDASKTIPQTYDNVRIAIPRAPGIGLLLERPVFESYNRKASSQGVVTGQGGPFGDVSFEKYEKEIEEFKQREIYKRIYEGGKEGEGVFEDFFAHVDGFKGGDFLWAGSGGVQNITRHKEPSDKDDHIDDRRVTNTDKAGASEESEQEDGTGGSQG